MFGDAEGEEGACTTEHEEWNGSQYAIVVTSHAYYEITGGYGKKVSLGVGRAISSQPILLL